MKKLQNSIQEKHPEAQTCTIPDEIGVDFNEEIQKECDKNQHEDQIGPVVGEMTQQMKWVQDFKRVYLVGYGWNYSENLGAIPKYSKIIIQMANFEDSKSVLLNSIRLRKYSFVSSWKDYVKTDENDFRWILKKDLYYINEEQHKGVVQRKMEERKETKLAKDKSKPQVPIPEAETKEEIQKKLLLAELAGPIKIEGEYIKYLYFKERAEKEGRGVNRTLPDIDIEREGRAMNITLPEFDMEAKRKIGQEQGGVPKCGRAPIRRERENDYEEMDDETEDENDFEFQ